ncbi:MAG TPA: hypothetical protein VGO54_12110 [Bradyrhizobium sp.]|nr:hypothetical protein [Bradyrhizobium sp.]
MLKSNFAPSIVPYGADQTIYLVVDNLGSLGSVFRETEIERADSETVIADLLSGQFSDPVRVVAFNTLEHWSEDFSNEIASEIQTRCDIAGDCVPDHLEDFVQRHKPHDRQLKLRLA